MTEENENRRIADSLSDEEKLEKIKEGTIDPPTVKLKINRVPKYVSDALKTEAQKNWGGDYGMALTFWHREQVSMQMAMKHIERLEERLDSLQSLITEAINTEDNKDEDKGLEVLNG